MEDDSLSPFEAGETFGPTPADDLLALAAALLVGGAGWAAYTASLRQGTEALRRESNHQLELFATAAEGVIKRQESIPASTSSFDC